MSARMVEGSPFECTKCGACCRWQGKVFLTPDDIKKLALHVGLAIDEFMSRYTENHGSSTVLKDKEDSPDCVFMDGDGCGVYGHHPQQCDEWPTSYDKRCPGFTNNGGEGRMDYKEAVERVNKRFSALREWDQAVTDQFYKSLAGASTGAEIASKALADGVDSSSGASSVKVASVDDLFAFHRASDTHLIHKSTRDLWSIETDKDGGVRITRLFDNDGEPIRG
jgi:Fe-S-cluster containining protein